MNNYFILTESDAKILGKSLIDLCEEVRKLKNIPYDKYDSVDAIWNTIIEIFHLDICDCM